MTEMTKCCDCGHTSWSPHYSCCNSLEIFRFGVRFCFSHTLNVLSPKTSTDDSSVSEGQQIDIFLSKMLSAAGRPPSAPPSPAVRPCQFHEMGLWPSSTVLSLPLQVIHQRIRGEDGPRHPISCWWMTWWDPGRTQNALVHLFPWHHVLLRCLQFLIESA